jgi:hypothetical protein
MPSLRGREREPPALLLHVWDVACAATFGRPWNSRGQPRAARLVVAAGCRESSRPPGCTSWPRRERVFGGSGPGGVSAGHGWRFTGDLDGPRSLGGPLSAPAESPSGAVRTRYDGVAGEQPHDGLSTGTPDRRSTRPTSGGRRADRAGTARSQRGGRASSATARGSLLAVWFWERSWGGVLSGVRGTTA